MNKPQPTSTAPHLVRGLLGCGTLVLAFFVVAVVAAVVMPSDPGEPPTTAESDAPSATSATGATSPATPPPATGQLDAEGRRHGEWREPSESGGYSTGHYEHGNKHGVWSYYASDGTRTGETTYRNGLAHGPWWVETPAIQMSGHYVDGVEHGESRVKTAIADVMSSATIGSYDMGKKVGVWTTVTESEDIGGTHRKEETYADGQIQAAVSTLNGEQCEVVRYKDGEKHGKREVWHPGGVPALVEHYVAGVLDGPCQEWHSNGQIAGETEYRDGEEVGTHKTWDEQGRLIEHWVMEGKRRTVFVMRGKPYPGPGR